MSAPTNLPTNVGKPSHTHSYTPSELPKIFIWYANTSFMPIMIITEQSQSRGLRGSGRGSLGEVPSPRISQTSNYPIDVAYVRCEIPTGSTALSPRTIEHTVIQTQFLLFFLSHRFYVIRNAAPDISGFTRFADVMYGSVA
jgi:hypothetical protein